MPAAVEPGTWLGNGVHELCQGVIKIEHAALPEEYKIILLNSNLDGILHSINFQHALVEWVTWESEDLNPGPSTPFTLEGEDSQIQCWHFLPSLLLHKLISASTLLTNLLKWRSPVTPSCHVCHQWIFLVLTWDPFLLWFPMNQVYLFLLHWNHSPVLNSGNAGPITQSSLYLKQEWNQCLKNNWIRCFFLSLSPIFFLIFSN